MLNKMKMKRELQMGYFNHAESKKGGVKKMTLKKEN